MLTPDLNTKELISVDLCCCAGGASCGTEQAGFKVVLGVDCDDRALTWHHTNFPNAKLIHKEIKDVSTEEILKAIGLKVGELPHLHCSWPCIENSSANTKAAGNPPEDINRVFFQFYDKIIALQPMVFTGENVDGALMGKKKKYFNQIIRALNALPNYTFKYKLMNAPFYGLSSNRRRLSIIGKRNDIAPGVLVENCFPKPDYEGAKKLTLDYVMPHIIKYRSGQFQNNEILGFNHYMCTMTAHNSVEVLVNGNWRKLTVEEVRFFMGFPKEFLLPEFVTLAMELLGNAVPPPMMCAIMTQIKNTIFKDIGALHSANTAVPSPDSTPIVNNVAFVNKPSHNIINNPTPRPGSSINNIRPGKIITSQDLIGMQFNELNFTGKWETFLGSPSNNFYCIVHGIAGEGKSTLGIQFADYLSNKFGKVLYISGEEGISKTFRDKFILTNSVSPSLHVVELKSFQDILRVVQPAVYSFIFIDSLQHLKIDAVKMRELRSRYKNSAFISISQSTKDGSMRGSAEHAHDADIVIEVVKGLATTTKNRFKEKGATFNVFEIMTECETPIDSVVATKEIIDAPPAGNDEPNSREELELLLKEALAKEDFEAAAKFRDRISKMKNN